MSHSVLPYHSILLVAGLTPLIGGDGGSGAGGVEVNPQLDSWTHANSHLGKLCQETTIPQ